LNKKPFKRVERVASLVMRELAIILQQHPDNSFKNVTITEVKIAPDFSSAHIFVTFLLNDNQKINTEIKQLNREAKRMQHKLAQVVDLRRTPELFFIFDDTIERGKRIDKILESIK
jgi:ribosome-binding factor A